MKTYTSLAYKKVSVNRRTRIFSKKSLIKLLSIIVLISMMIDFSAIFTSADTFYNIRINYVFADGTPAHDPYVATYPASESSLDLEVKNPTITGYDPMTAKEEGLSAETSTIHLDHIDRNVELTVYYIAGLSSYRVMYYKQNIYDDLYTRDNTISGEYTNRRGKTGTNPTVLETEELPGYEGFTNLFHEPDAIAADGSTVFRVYYDRNYYHVMFDVGEGGYGVEPVYAKYQTTFRIGVPTRIGYTFMGWARTSADSTQGVEGEDWYYIPMDADASAEGFDPAAVSLTEQQATASAVTFNDGVVPAYNTYYKAMWVPGTTKFSAVYWVENSASTLTEADYEGVTNEEARALLSQNYTVAAIKDVYEYANGTSVDADDEVNGETWIKNAQGQSMQLKDFFSYNLNYADPDEPRNDPDNANYDPDIRYDVNDKKIDFLDISKGSSDDISGHRDFFTMVWDTENTDDFFLKDSSKTVAGDGTTKLNFYFSRKVFTLKFIYARQKLVNGAPTGAIDLTNSTKNFSRNDYINSSGTTYKNAVAKGTWRENIAETLPHIKPQYLVENGGKLNEEYYDYGGYRYFFYHFDAKYNSPLEGKWLIDAITPVQRSLSDTLSPGTIINPGSWAVEFGTKYYYDHTTVNNYTIKGIYDKLGDDLMFTASNRTTMTGKNMSYTELHYLLSWTNTGETKSTNWNIGANHMLHFTYENYVELLLWQTDIIDEEGAAAGIQMLKDMDLYDDIMQHSYTKQDGTTVTKWYGLPLKWMELNPTEVQRMQEDQDGDGEPDGSAALTEDGTYKKVKFDDTDGKYYGLKSIYRVETMDSGSQYSSTTASNTRNVRTNQTASDISGFEIEYLRKTAKQNDPNAYFVVDGQTSGTEVSKYRSDFKKDQVILDDCNTSVDWSDDNPNNRHATIKFFYRRRDYTLSYRNGNADVESAKRTVEYGAPLNQKYAYDDDDGQYSAGDWRYYYEDPEYFNSDLRDHYEFKGWYYTPYYFRQVDIDTSYMPADDLTLYAKWEPKTIQVTFYNTYNDYYEDVNRIADPVDVHYGSYIDTEDIPANVADPESTRPVMTPPASGAMFAGWYYLRDNIPVRFEPENLPVTALNQESSGENATFHLYAEWVTKEVGKYQIKYVEKDHPENEVADPTTGRAFVWKTRTFNAKGGSDLNADHAWQEDGINWWPVANSHSLVIRANDHSGSDYSPNEYSFEYIQKTGVWYRVQYLDATTHASLADPVETYTTNASVKADALFIPSYVAEEISKTLVLSASQKTGDEAKAEELENNVINFYYNQNDSAYLYEVEYYGQNVDDNDYELIQTENIEVPIGDDPDTPEIEPTSVLLSDIYNRQYAQLFAVNGFTRVAGATQQVVTNADGTTVTTALADNASFTVASDKKTTIRVYFDRNSYPYTYRYVDYQAERKYLDTPEADRAGMWNGVMETHHSTVNERVEKEVTITVPTDLTYNDIPYIRVGEDDVVLTIAPDENNPDVNVINIYYRKFDERELQYKLVCKESQYSAIDYDETKDPRQPLYGGLSMTGQTVDTYSEIQSVNFYDFNDALVPNADSSLPEVDRYLHNHRYTFLGWFDNPEGTGTPLSTDAELTPAEMVGNTEELPAYNTTYYAVVEQDMVHANFEFRTIEQALPIGGDSGETEEDRQAAAIVGDAPTDTDGSKTGSFFNFSSPNNYVNGEPTPWERTSGYNLTVDPIDDRVYKYEFAEWWEEDLTPGDNYGKLIRKKNWNSDGQWSPTVLQQVLDRHDDKHIIAVFKRREVTELPYTINYQFTDRFGNERTFVKKGRLTGDQLVEGSENCAITSDGDFRLTDEFILSLAPYETNYGETLRWSNREGMITKTSVKEGTVISEGDDPTTEDRVYATITAVQDTKTVYARYRLTPDGEYEEPIQTFYGANYNLDPNMKEIEAPASYNGMAFSYWAVRKSDKSDDKIVAKSYDTLFDLCMMDNYYLTPVYEGAADGPGTKSATLDTGTLGTGEEDWLAWTWNTGEEGVWVRPDTSMRFSGLKDMAKFARVPAGTALSAINWSTHEYLWNWTEDLTVQDGGIYHLTGYGQYYVGDPAMLGEWGESTDSGEPEETPAEGAASVKLTHLDYSRNRWTDENGNVDASGETDLLFSDFEIAFEDNGNQIYNSDDYKCGVVLEYCATVPDAATFNPERDYNQVTDYNNLADAVNSHLSGNTVTQYDYKTNKPRSIVFCDIPTDSLTNHDRIEFYRYIFNSYINEGTDDDPIIKHNKCNYLIKVTAYLVKDGQVTFSRDDHVYMCYKSIAAQDSALSSMIENSGN